MAFRRFAASVVAWEAMALATEHMERCGRLKRRWPFITDVVRGLPHRLRVAFVLSMAFVLYEHLEQMRLTRLATRWVIVKEAPSRNGAGPLVVLERVDV